MLVQYFDYFQDVRIEDYGEFNIYEYENQYLVAYHEVEGEDNVPENAINVNDLIDMDPKRQSYQKIEQDTSFVDGQEESFKISERYDSDYEQELGEIGEPTGNEWSGGRMGEESEGFTWLNNLSITDFVQETEEEKEERQIMEMKTYRKQKEISLRKKICYQLLEYKSQLEGYDISFSDTEYCRRFDLELELASYDPTELEEFRKLVYNSALKKLIKRSQSSMIRRSSIENDISRLFFEIVHNRVVICGKTIWCYRGNKWQKSKDENFLWTMLSNQFLQVIQDYESLSDVSNYLGAYTTRRNIMNDCKLKLSCSGFSEKIDSNPEIIGVKNGTLNLLNGKLTEPSEYDLISKNTNIEYMSEINHQDVESLMVILNEVFPDPELLGFFLRSCSTFLEGYNSKKLFYVWWGLGNNCKTGMTSLVQAALGEYCGIAPVSLITSRRTGSSQATPELCHIEGKLVVFLQEPNQNEKIKTGRIKELTGNDKMFIRNLYEEAREIQIKCKLVHVCNFPTVNSNTDTAFKRRMLVIKFPSTFINKEDYEEREENKTLPKNTFRSIDNIESKLKNYAKVFLHILVKEYQAFRRYGLNVPSVIRKSTEEFLTYNNYALKFIKSHLVITQHQEQREKVEGISIQSIYDLFKSWYKDMYPSYNVPNIETFARELTDEGFTEIDGVVTNVTLSDKNINIKLSP